MIGGKHSAPAAGRAVAAGVWATYGSAAPQHNRNIPRCDLWHMTVDGRSRGTPRVKSSAEGSAIPGKSQGPARDDLALHLAGAPVDGGHHGVAEGVLDHPLKDGGRLPAGVQAGRAEQVEEL